MEREGCEGLDGFKKWSKGKQKEKVNNMVLFDQATYDKMLSEIPKAKLITPSTLSERLRLIRKLRKWRNFWAFNDDLKQNFRSSEQSPCGFDSMEVLWHMEDEDALAFFRVNGSLTRRAIKDLMARGSIRMVSAHASQQIYTRASINSVNDSTSSWHRTSTWQTNDD
ncbi:hypothetical protein Cgig2_028668 [Carnegiea gigantea]|uniref:40S ribosomal protein S25 n=1 Tax=Carnegiea gigantea TaxID=171969 RepID=A0A9Q1KBQ1_9CARY|nr:hypothetical protein Cgig2_028668 [Carnegiea gigantea]